MDPVKCSEITTIAPDVFFKLAAHYHQEPEELAFLLLHDFCLHPPKALTIIDWTASGSEEGGRS